MLGSPASPAATRTKGYASKGLAGLTTQIGLYQRPELAYPNKGRPALYVAGKIKHVTFLLAVPHPV
jgi:hypothetical protein